MPATFQDLRSAAQAGSPDAAIILGSGMGQASQRVRAEVSLSFADVPGLPAPTIAGHAGRIVLGEWAGRRVLLFLGRVHRYEGCSEEEVARPVRLAAELGARVLLCTNAAGGIRDDLRPGSLMAIRSHLDWMRPNCGRSAPAAVYSAQLRGLLQEAAGELAEGIYAAVSGPCYETPAEIRALRQCGADAVGMSTSQEIQAGHELGMECAAVSLITNRAAGLSGGPIHHEEVLASAAAAAERFANLIEAFLNKI